MRTNNEIIIELCTEFTEFTEYTEYTDYKGYTEHTKNTGNIQNCRNMCIITFNIKGRKVKNVKK